jgi:Phosphotransferase enzyme family
VRNSAQRYVFGSKGGVSLSEHEEVLDGGNINKVVKIGGTVRRAAKPNPYVYELLKHLEKVGYHCSPRFMGVDEKGREILSYLDGVVPGNDYPKIERYMWSDEALVEHAKLLRSYHDATVGFIASTKSINEYPEMSLHEVVCHNDAALYNIVFQDKHPVGIIDFDMAGPGPRIWDIVYTLYTSVPLAAFSPSEDEDRVVVQYKREDHAAARKRRIEIFINSYGMDVPNNLKEWTISRINFMCTTLSDRAASGDLAFIKLVEEGHLAHYEKEVKFLKEHFDDWW